MPVTNLPRGLTLDTTKHITISSGSTVPAAGTADYNPGCKFTLSNASLGQCMEWVNLGTATSCLFVPTGLVYGYGFAWAGGPVDCVNGEVATQYTVDGAVGLADICFAAHQVSDDNDQIIGVACAESSAPGEQNSLLITAGADPLTAHDYVYAGLKDKCVPKFDIVAAGTHTTVGGAAAEAITVTGAIAGDIALVCLGATDDTDTISDSICTADTLTVTLSADPLVAHSIHYVVLRERGAFRPSHYVAYAGEHTSVGGDAVEVATVTGVLATDVIVTNIEDATSGAANVLKVVATANTITWTFNADPTADHNISYAVLRAY